MELDWANVLSLGEQQRLAFARLLLVHPPYAILDEATSALDLENEEQLYQQVQATSTVFISVGRDRTPPIKCHNHAVTKVREPLLSILNYLLTKICESKS